MKSGAILLLAVLLLSAISTNAQYYPYYPRFGYPGFGGGFGRGFGGGFGPRWGGGRGLAFLGSAALLRSGNPLGRSVGALGLGSLLFG